MNSFFEIITFNFVCAREVFNYSIRILNFQLHFPQMRQIAVLQRIELVVSVVPPFLPLRGWINSADDWAYFANSSRFIRSLFKCRLIFRERVLPHRSTVQSSDLMGYFISLKGQVYRALQGHANPSASEITGGLINMA